MDDTDKIVIITDAGIMLKIRVKEIRSCGRSTQGVRLIHLTGGSSVGSLARIPKAEAPEEPAGKPKSAPADATDLLPDDLEDIEEEEIEEGVEEEEEEPGEEQ